MPEFRINRRLALAGGFATGLALLALPGRASAGSALRVVCAGSDITETVAALAGAGVIQGVDTTSRTPPQVRDLPSIGYLRQISAEGVLSLRPDILVASKDLGPAAAVEQLRGAGLRIELIAFAPSAEGMAAKVRHIGGLLGRDAEAEALAERIGAAMADLERRLSAIAVRPSIGFIRSIDGGTPVAGGRMNLVDATYALAGGRNAFDFPVFKPVSREVLAATPPDFIVTDGSAVKAGGGEAAFIESLGLSQAFAGRPERLIVADMSTLFSFGPSAPARMTALARRLHPDRFAG